MIDDDFSPLQPISVGYFPSKASIFGDDSGNEHLHLVQGFSRQPRLISRGQVFWGHLIFNFFQIVGFVLFQLFHILVDVWLKSVNKFPLSPPHRCLRVKPASEARSWRYTSELFQ